MATDSIYCCPVKALDPGIFHHYEINHGGPVSHITMLRMTPLMAVRLANYAQAKGCGSSVVVRCAIHQLLLDEGIDAYSPADQPLPKSL